MSATEQKITKLNEEVAKQSKVDAENPSILQDLMFNIENLGDNMVNMSNKISSWTENEAMEVEEELAVLAGSISFSELVKKVSEIIDLLATSSDT